MSATVIGAPAQLQQVIVNLVRNAAQAIGEDGGQIRLRLARLAVLESRPLSLGMINTGDYVRLSVSDTGRGMDEATRRRIFDAFFTTKSAGTGLGLATVADILRDHGGAIDVRSTPGQGSIFEAWLPQGREAAPSINIRLGQGEVVMVVDDDVAQLTCPLRSEPPAMRGRGQTEGDWNGAQASQAGGDRRQAASGRSAGWTGQACGGRGADDWGDGGDLLPVAL